MGILQYQEFKQYWIPWSKPTKNG